MEKKSEISIILKEICQIANLLFQETNTELEVTSTDKSVISVEKAKGINIKLVANKAGTSTVTVRPKYNPASAKTYKITVYDPLQINKFEADTNDPKIGEKVNLSVEAQNGSGDLQYKFYEENEDGDQTKTLKKHTVI